MTQMPHTRPVLLGCSAVLGLATIAVLVVIALVAFLDSGADSGRMVLEQAAAYAPGSAEFVGSREFYLVRVKGGDFHALANLDAANRASQGRRCPVAPLAANDPDYAGLLAQYRSRMSPQAEGGTLLFREACHRAVYDAAGVRLDTDGPNLDRYPVTVRADGRVVVDVSARSCSRREGTSLLASAPCP